VGTLLIPSNFTQKVTIINDLFFQDGGDGGDGDGVSTANNFFAHSIPNRRRKYLISVFLVQKKKAGKALFRWVTIISAKNLKRQRRKRQSVTAKREKSQTPES